MYDMLKGTVFDKKALNLTKKMLLCMGDFVQKVLDVNDIVYFG